MPDLTELHDEVEDAPDLGDAIAMLLDGLADLFDGAADNPDEVRDLAVQVRAGRHELAEAAACNTPAGPNQPTEIPGGNVAEPEQDATDADTEDESGAEDEAEQDAGGPAPTSPPDTGPDTDPQPA